MNFIVPYNLSTTCLMNIIQLVHYGGETSEMTRFLELHKRISLLYITDCTFVICIYLLKVFICVYFQEGYYCNIKTFI